MTTTTTSPATSPTCNPSPIASLPPRRTAALLVLACIAIALPACQKPLFDARDPRSQYDRTDSVRNTRPEQFVFDEYGSRRPNIRGRLIGNQ